MRIEFFYLTGIAFSGLLISSCTTIQGASSIQEGESVIVAQNVEATIGDVMVDKYNYISTPTAKLLEPIEGSPLLAGYNGMPTGYILLGQMINGKLAYCGYGVGSVVPCFIDSDADNRLDQIYTIGVGTLGPNRISKPILFSKSTSANAAGFKYELLYQGISESVLNISYREYIENMARPAFQQDLKYTLEHNKPT